MGTDSQIPLQDGKKVTAINFDNAATTPPFFYVWEKITDFAPWYSSIHRGTGYKSILSSDLYEEGREAVKNFVNADSKRDVIIFTKNTTESINMLSYALFQENREQVILSTDMEHLANDLPWKSKFQTDYIGIDDYGRLSLKDLKKKLEKYQGKVQLVTVTGASNVTGYINPVYQIAKIARQYGAKILVDAAQLAPHAPLDMKPFDSEEHLDYLVFSAHKMYAPLGVAVLIGPKETFDQVKPVYQGGGCVRLVCRQFIKWENSPYRNEAGTPNVIGVVALTAAIKTLSSLEMIQLYEYEKDLINYALEGLKSIPNISLYCHVEKKEARVSLISFNMEGIYHRVLAEILSAESGIAVRSGLFCAHPYVEKLLNLGAQDLEYYHDHPATPFPGMVRISFGLYNNREEIEIFIDLLRKISKKKNYYNNKYKKILGERLAKQGFLRP